MGEGGIHPHKAWVFQTPYHLGLNSSVDKLIYQARLDFMLDEFNSVCEMYDKLVCG